MVKVITYGTYDLLHYGHISLLKRAKALGDYLIVGVTADDYDKTRGKINVQQPLSERIDAVRATGIADEIIVEEYEGQKIDDIRRYDVDIFTVGSDWIGYFDYLEEYCKVVYLDRTKGVSSSKIREHRQSLRLGLVGHSSFINKIEREAKYVDGITLSGVCADNTQLLSDDVLNLPVVTNDYEFLLTKSDAVYLHALPEQHENLIREALVAGKHVLCESPISLSKKIAGELFKLAKEKNLILVDALRTAYSTAYYRLRLLLKSGKIGKVVSIDATCTSLIDNMKLLNNRTWNSITAWGPTGLLPVFQILGTDYKELSFVTHFYDEEHNHDAFTKISLLYENSVATVKVGNGVKSEGELIISGTKGYIYVPAPWWKTDYFEIRYENPADNKRYFYQLEGEGIRNELAEFAKTVTNFRQSFYIEQDVSIAFSNVMERFTRRLNMSVI